MGVLSPKVHAGVGSAYLVNTGSCVTGCGMTVALARSSCGCVGELIKSGLR